MRQRRTKSRGTNASVARFQAERRALRKVQVHFEFQQSLMRKVRLAAAEENLSYSDYVRKLVGLPYAKIQRPRISLSFGEQDLELLAGRYAEFDAGPGALKRRVMEEVEAHFEDARVAPGHSGRAQVEERGG